MNILLINQPTENTIASVMPKELEEGLSFLPPLGLMYIAAYLKTRTAYNVEILDCQVGRMDYDRLREEVRRKNPDVVGITAMTFTLIDVMKTARTVKEVNPQTKVVLGGPHVMIFPNETIEKEEIDFLILGEGESAIKPLLENMDNPEKLKKIRGLVFKDGGTIINNGRADFIENLDNLPFPARYLTPYKKYFSVLSPRRPVTTMFTSRGCPFKCLFCDRPQLGKLFRARSAKSVVDEMEECDKMGIQEIFIYDDTFGVDRRRVLDICNEIDRRGISIVWDIRTRVNTVDKEVLEALKRAGCQRIHYGVEAGTQKILNVLRKGITLKQAEEAFKTTKRVGIQTAGYFMIGCPTETKEDIEQTVKFMKKLNPDYVHITIATPFPATDLYRMAQEEGVLLDVWRDFAKDPKPGFFPPVWEKVLSRDELLSLLGSAYRSFYFRPSYALKKILQLKSMGEFLHKTKAALQLFKI